MRLPLGKVDSCPRPPDSITELKCQVIKVLATAGIRNRMPHDRVEFSVEYKSFDVLLRAAGDLEIHLKSFTQGVRVGLGARMPHYTSRKGNGDWHNQPTTWTTKNHNQTQKRRDNKTIIQWLSCLKRFSQVWTTRLSEAKYYDS